MYICYVVVVVFFPQILWYFFVTIIITISITSIVIYIRYERD